MTDPAPRAPLPGHDHPLLPAGFTFGTATAAYAVEGAASDDGRGPSIWDTFSHTPGRTTDGTTGDDACDHYRRVEEDVALVADLGATGHRFSVSWSRVQPDGRGAVNEKGLDFYDRLVDSLLERGIAPMVTLYHWDLPQALEDDGGWLNRATSDRFADYAGLVGERLADRVAHWVPVNEPSVVTMLGYSSGVHAPGKELVFDAMPVAHHLLLGHGRAASALRSHGAQSVGCANNHSPVWPDSEDPVDTGMSKIYDQLWNGLYMEPMLLGRYPVDIEPLLEHVVRPGDLATIRQPLDFYGVSYFHPVRIAAADEGAEVPFEHREIVGRPTTDLGWPVAPEALREWLIIFRARYRAALPPIVVTGSGCAYDTGPDEHGVVDDQARIDYHAAHVRAISDAVNRGVDIRGYYAWSLLDGFEWASGHSQRFGLVHVDRATQRRTPKRSYAWYADLIASQPSADA